MYNMHGLSFFRLDYFEECCKSKFVLVVLSSEENHLLLEKAKFYIVIFLIGVTTVLEVKTFLQIWV